MDEQERASVYLLVYLLVSYLAEQKRKSIWLSSIREKTAWDWLSLLVVPILIATIAGMFTLFTVSQQNEIFRQRDEAEKERNQQALLIEYLDEISELVEKQLLTLNDDDNSKAQRTIARARTLSVLRALDSDRKGELIQFLSAARLIERDKPIIDLNRAYLEGANLGGANLEGANLGEANLEGANLEEANFWGAYLWGANLKKVDLGEANLQEVDLREVDLGGANLEEANLGEANLREVDLRKVDLGGANLEGANLGGANLEEAKNLNSTQIKSACNWEKAKFSKEFKQKLAQEPDQKVDCSKWD